MKLRHLCSILIIFSVLMMQSPDTAWAVMTCDLFTVTPTTASPGDLVTLDWLSTEAVEANIDVIGAVATTGSTSFVVPNSPGLFTFTLELFNGNISEPTYEYCTADLTIVGPAVCDYFFATPGTLDGAGNVTLEWGTTGADVSVTIDNGVGVVAAVDTLVVPVATSTIFTLTAAGTNGSSQCLVPVTVTATASTTISTNSSNGGGGKSINPRCEVSVDATEVEVGDTVLVSWNSSNADSLNLTALQSSQSNTLLSATSAEVVKSGSFPYVVTSNTTFKVIVSRPNRTADCVAAVTVRPDGFGGAGLGDTTGLISLASVPVTGFDPTVGFIILLNAFLAFGAAMGAYVFVTFSHQYKRATDRSFTNTHVFTPIHALFSQERRSLHSRIILWKWLAVVLSITFVAVLLLMR